MTPLEDLQLSEDELKTAHGTGDYLVGVHITPEVWGVEGSTNCQWTVFDITSDAITDGTGSATVIVSDDAYWVRVGRDCTRFYFKY